MRDDEELETVAIIIENLYAKIRQIEAEVSKLKDLVETLEHKIDSSRP